MRNADDFLEKLDREMMQQKVFMKGSLGQATGKIETSSDSKAVLQIYDLQSLDGSLSDKLQAHLEEIA